MRKKEDILYNGIPVSPGLNPALESENIQTPIARNKNRLLMISALAVLIAAVVSAIAKLLMALLYLITHLSFFGEIGFDHVTPMGTSLGIWIILIPAAGGLLVGLMALFGSKAIRGHGIPEAMEQILTNQSQIKPAITFLKPVSSAIAIGTGGPFGAEGPIIATGGALGSTMGQLLKISDKERKILLSSGATAGMAAIFGSPIAAIFLAIELLLFEFSPRAIIPVALACVTGAVGHHFLFGPAPVFPMIVPVEVPSNTAILIYSFIGLLIGVLSVLVTKAVYAIEDGFGKLPFQWMWWPALGGLFVGIVGYFAPETLGVGYENITELLNGSLTLRMVLSLCFLKFISWAIALGSGTSGGTLAPLLTIGGAAGILIGLGVLYIFPGLQISLSLCALVGMSALFAGASRALLTSIIFALEVTGQANALLPLLAASTASYFVSFFLMDSTIMTEKISRRGIRTPDSYEPDKLSAIPVNEVMRHDVLVINENNKTGEVRDWFKKEIDHNDNYFIIVNDLEEYRGIISFSNLFSHHHPEGKKVGELIKRRFFTITKEESLRTAVLLMARENIDLLPVVDKENKVIAMISFKDIMAAYKEDEESKRSRKISLRRHGLKMLVRGQKLIDTVKRNTLS